MNLKQWILGVLGAFIDGFIDGFPVGSTAGGAIGAADGQMTSDFTVRSVAIMAAHFLAVPIFTGLADVRSFHKEHRLAEILISAGKPPTSSPSVNPTPTP